MNRRHFLVASGVGLAGLGAFGLLRPDARAGDSATFPFHLDARQWRKRLTPAQFRILRESGTEPPFSSPLDKETRAGLYHCAGCALPLYSSATKYDSGTGWPSFWKPLPHAVGRRSDHSLFMARTEIHCRRCGGHLGHVFNDGPQPTGLRYCMNGLALTFHPGETA